MLQRTLKAAIKLMLQGNMCKGKEVILDHVTSVLTFNRSGQYLDCYGSEYAHAVYSVVSSYLDIVLDTKLRIMLLSQSINTKASNKLLFSTTSQ